MSKRPFIVFGVFAAICVLVIPFLALAKEGDEGAGTVEVASQDREAKNLFANNCGTCHTLAAAGTDGVVGPNLDQLLVPSGTNDAGLYEGNAGRVLQRGRSAGSKAGCRGGSWRRRRRARRRSSSPPMRARSARAR